MVIERAAQLDVSIEMAASDKAVADKSRASIAAISPIAGASVALSACGGGGRKSPNPPPNGGGQPLPLQHSNSSITLSQRNSARAALHASLGVTEKDIEVIEQGGIGRWLDGHLSLENENSASQFFATRGIDEIDANLYFQRDYLFDHMVWADLLSGGNRVRKRMALALSEIFVVSVNRLNISWPSQAVGAYWDLLNQHAFGQFRNLLEAITLNPAMGVFLDTRGNQREDPITGRVPDENYAREVMQLFTIGLYELNQDGSRKLSAGIPIETYGNDDVMGLAKVFTGYDLDFSGVEFHPHPSGAGRPVPDVKLVRQPLTPDPRKWNPPSASPTHSLDEKRFLGVVIPAGTGPEDSLKIALDHLCNHPNVGPFIGKQLIQRLVTSNPSPQYVQRIAEVFANNGKGVRGDLGAVFKAIITDPEANSSESLVDPKFGKLREPMIRYAQWGQTFGAFSKSVTWQMRNLSPPTLLNQAPLRSPSVFNFFRPEYSPPRTQAAANGMLAPEFQLVNESSVAGYVNFIRGTVDGRNYWTDNIEASYERQISFGEDPKRLLDHLDLVLTGGQLRDPTRALILKAIEDVPIDSTDKAASTKRRVWVGVCLVMCCNEYLVQK